MSEGKTHKIITATVTAPVDQYPLCVDLDGTLIRSDLLVESSLVLLKRNPLNFFLMIRWLLKGKACLKQQIASRVDLDAEKFPYNQPFYDYLLRQKAEGRQLLLATASNEKYAQAVADHTALFDLVMASDSTVNLSGKHKAEYLIEAFGERGFDYAGNAKVDLAVWKHARQAVLVNPERGVRRQAERVAELGVVFDHQASKPEAWLRAVRPHQWLKNLLLFVPIIMAHRLSDPALLLQVVLAFMVFSFCASSVYLLNDLFDIEADRQHKFKRYRPFAAGDIPAQYGLIIAQLLLLVSLVLSLLLPPRFTIVLLIYYLFTLAYTLRLKQSPLVDVLVLASLYTIRIIAGAEAAELVSSFWLLAFSMFLFFSLAQVKRYSELCNLDPTGKQAMSAARGYRAEDQEGLAQSGIASGYLSVLVLALYINSPQVECLYRYPKLIWLLCPLLLFWIGRMWMLARRGEMNEDPVLFALRDRRSYVVGVLIALILWAAV